MQTYIGIFDKPQARIVLQGVGILKRCSSTFVKYDTYFRLSCVRVCVRVSTSRKTIFKPQGVENNVYFRTIYGCVVTDNRLLIFLSQLFQTVKLCLVFRAFPVNSPPFLSNIKLLMIY